MKPQPTEKLFPHWAGPDVTIRRSSGSASAIVAIANCFGLKIGASMIRP